MKWVTVRETSVELPVLSGDLEPAQVQSLSAERGTLSTFELAGSPMRALDVKNVHLVDGRVRALRAETAVVRGLTARSVDFAADSTLRKWSICVSEQLRLQAVSTSEAVGSNDASLMGISTKCQLAVPLGGVGNIFLQTALMGE